MWPGGRAENVSWDFFRFSGGRCDFAAQKGDWGGPEWNSGGECDVFEEKLKK